MQVRVESCSLHSVYHGRCMPHCALMNCLNVQSLVVNIISGTLCTYYYTQIREQLLGVISCPYNINYVHKLFLSEESAGANTILIALTIVNFIVLWKNL